MIDISGLTLEQLGRLRMQIDDLFRIKHAESIAKARQEILVIAQDVGVPIRKLMDYPKEVKKPPRMPVRIQHPEIPGLTWTGKGRHPNWMKELLAKGKSMEDLKST